MLHNVAIRIQIMDKDTDYESFVFLLLLESWGFHLYWIELICSIIITSIVPNWANFPLTSEIVWH